MATTTKTPTEVYAQSLRGEERGKGNDKVQYCFTWEVPHDDTGLPVTEIQCDATNQTCAENVEAMKNDNDPGTSNVSECEKTKRPRANQLTPFSFLFILFYSLLIIF